MGLPSSPDERSDLLRAALAELTTFDTAVSEVRRRIAPLPPPITPILLVSLRYAEEIRHGTDHLVHALRGWGDASTSLDQLRDARIHLANLLPDFFMHIDGVLLRWCEDALEEAGLCGANIAEERDVRRLIQRYGDARANRTARRHDCIATLRSVFDDAIELAQRTQRLTEERVIRQRVELSQQRMRTNRTRWRAWVGFITFGIGVLLWLS